MQENVGVGEETSVVERGLRDDRESPRVSKESSTQQSGNDKPQPRPWNGQVARMSVVPPCKGTLNRRLGLKEQKETLSKGLSSTPYIEFSWEGKDQKVKALLDSGADWSLIDESIMSRAEREMIGPSSIEGKGVTGEKVDIVGEVWRSLNLGGLMLQDQRFVVVRNMITDVILGADLWSRVSPLTFDFKNQVVCLGEYGVELPLQYHRAPDTREESKCCRVSVKGKWTIPPATKMVVEGKVKGRMLPRTDYLFEPQQDEESLIGMPYSVVQSREKGDKVLVSVTNFSSSPVDLSEGHIPGKSKRRSFCSEGHGWCP